MTTAPGVAAALEAAAPGAVRRKVSLAPFCSYKTGGAADWLVEPSTEAQVAAVLAAVRELELPLFVLGGGTNLLVRDGGVRGVTLRLGRTFRTAEVRGTELHAGAVAPMSLAGAAAERAGLTGFEFAFDIPGTVGGALRMNAGAHGGEIRDVLARVEGCDLAGKPVRVEASEIRFSYRRAVYPADMVFLRGVFALAPGDPAEVAGRRRRYHEYRLATQPKGLSVGSTFINPEGDKAGRLIEAAGLKGFRVGDAVVSIKHANWILNEGKASAAEIEAVIDAVRERVRERFGVDLEPEVRIVGEPAGREALR